MLRHLLKLVWNRKRANALIVAEIFMSFIVLFAVITVAITFALNWRRPLGFDWNNVWNVRMDFDVDAREPEDPKLRATMNRLLTEVGSFPEVQSVALSNTPPYAFSTSEGSWMINGRMVKLIFDEVSDDYAEVMRMKVVRGRWFMRSDDALEYQPVVLDVNAASAVYGDDDPIGKVFDEGGDGRLPSRVVGVVGAYRKNGEASPMKNMTFMRTASNGRYGRVPSNMVLRLQPGTPAAFEEQLTKRLLAVAPDISFRVRHMDQMRRTQLRMQFAPAVVGAIVATFLITMVALGLTGVLWQTVTRRTREIGLRRAMGASSVRVRGQILAEVVLLATIALLLASVIVLQFPILGAFGFVTPTAFAIGFVCALATIYGLTVLCGLYPSWMASRLAPAEALRYE